MVKLVLLPYTAISPPRLNAADTLPPTIGQIRTAAKLQDHACGRPLEELCLVDNLDASEIKSFQPLFCANIQEMKVFTRVHNTQTPDGEDGQDDGDNARCAPCVEPL